jgi:Asp-tRNA(Asn)/Glu-tRNA(Gln) amidotransferase A subunit family amidase
MRTFIIPLASTQYIGVPSVRTVTDIAIVLDAIVGYDPNDPQTAASVGNIAKSYTDFLQLTGLRGARVGVLTDLLGTDPADAEVATAVREAVREMKGQSAEIVDVAIPGLKDCSRTEQTAFWS